MNRREELSMIYADMTANPEGVFILDSFAVETELHRLEYADDEGGPTRLS